MLVVLLLYRRAHDGADSGRRDGGRASGAHAEGGWHERLYTDRGRGQTRRARVERQLGARRGAQEQPADAARDCR